jgi:hypothetical protein
MEGTHTSICMICGQFRPDGIRIISAFLCDGCESMIVQTDVTDLKYPFYVQQMKQIFYKMDA